MLLQSWVLTQCQGGENISNDLREATVHSVPINSLFGLFYDNLSLLSCRCRNRPIGSFLVSSVFGSLLIFFPVLFSVPLSIAFERKRRNC